MRLLLALSLLLLAAPLRAQEGDAPETVSLDPSSGEINVDDTVTVTFPAPMVTADKIDAGGQPAPVTFLPAVQGEWTWKSATDGRFVVKAGLAPARKYRVVISPGLRDLAGKPVVQKLDAEFTTKAFTAKSEWGERTRLSPRPLVEVEFTWGVDLSDAAERIYFQDRESFARVGAEVNVALKPADALKTGAMTLRVAPRDALAVGRNWDLILDGVRAKTDGSSLSFLTRIPVGSTQPMTVQWLGGFNLPREKPRIVAKFSDEIEPDAAAKAVTLEPTVPNLKVRADRDDLILEGDFDLKQRYRVRISQELKGVRGFGLAAPSSWAASFRPKDAAVFFPTGAVLRQRAGAGLTFALVQTSTGPITWHLAPVPFEKFAEIQDQLRNFDVPRVDPVTKEPAKDPRTGRPLGRETEPFVEAFALQAVANGEVPALTSAEGEETLRRIAWAPPAGSPPLNGLYVLEAVGPAADGSGRRVGNRCLVSFSDIVLTQKRTPYGNVVRAARMEDGRPVAGARVRLVNAANHRLLEETTNAEGMATLTFDDKTRPKGASFYLLATAAEGSAPAVQPWDAPPFADSVSGEREVPAFTQLRIATLTDRNLYRPGQTVKIKGFTRHADSIGRIYDIPAGKPVLWRVTSSGSPVAEGNAVVGAEGGWEGEWEIPATAKLGEHSLEVTVGGVKSEQSPLFRVAEFKVPLFEVEAQALPPAKSGEEKDARVRVASRYFSGQPNAGAKVRWKAKWRAPEDMGGEVTDPATETSRYFRLLDRQSENAGPAEEDAETKGEATLGADGSVEITAALPAPFQGPRYAVDWEITVTSAEGQAVSPNDDVRSVVLRQPALLGANLAEPLRRAAGKEPVAPLDLAWFDRDQKMLDTAATRDLPAEADVEWFRITTKTVKEKLAPFTFAYRNAPQFNPAGRFKARVNATLDLPAAQPGRYVAVVRAAGMRAVSSEVIVTGLGEDEVPVRNDSSLDVLRVSAPKDAPAVGAKASLAVRSPVTGTAWVSVESEGKVLSAWTMPVAGNTSSLEIPIDESFAPNARVAVYLLSPGGATGVPQERFGATELPVRQPAWTLEVRPKFDAREAMPGETVRGVVEVRSEGKAVGDADLTLYAVDDAILALGQWKPLDLGGTMRPPRTARVRTLQGLDGYVSEWNERSQFQKGFIIGGGGRDNERPIRKDFKALAYWKTGVRTDAQGRAAFDFPAPDSLTRYRFVAVAQTRQHQFGVGTETVEISRPLIAEPALPRFVRRGDEVELRAVVRLGRSAAKPGPVTVRLATDDGLKIDGPATLRQEVRAGDPTVFVFRARAAASGEKAVVRFAATSDADGAQTDDVEVTLPMESPLRPRREDVAGKLASGSVGPAQMPAAWRAPGASGTYETIVSTSPHLSRLLALPAMLDYPHGCFEQRGTRALAHALFTDLARSLPPGVVDTDRSRDALLETFALYDRYMRSNGRLPYWPNGAGGDDEDASAGPDNTNSFVTALAAWVCGASARANIPVPERLAKLGEATRKIAEDAKEPAVVRAFAVYALTAGVDAGKVDPGTFEELNRRRAEIGDDGRALLALALHARKLMAKEKDQLLREIAAAPEKERAFDPLTFSSTPRTSAMVLCALNTCAPAWWTPERRNAANGKLLARMDDLGAYSTQENLWALLSFRTVVAGAAAPAKLRAARGGGARISADGTAALLPARPLAESAAAEALVPPGVATTYVLRATYTPPPGGDVRRDGGIRLERVVRNLSDPARDGSPGKPFQAGDRLLVSWRMFTPKVRNFVTLEDELPAGVEMVNPDLKMVAEYYQIEEPTDAKWAALSFVERRDQRTRLYFDRLASGATSYSALARVTTGGSFRWPGAWASPMYDPRSFGESPGADVRVK